MKPHNFMYLFKEGARNLFANKLMSFACIGVLVACLLLIGGATLFSLNVNSIVQYWEQQNVVVAFLSEKVGPSDVDALELTLSNMDNIIETQFVSKEETLERSKEQTYEEYAGIFDGLEEDNPLLDSFVLRLKDPSIIEDTVAQLRSTEGIFKVNAVTDVAHILSGLKRTVSVAGMAIVVILVAVSVVIITNTIKITVFNRRKEINIMRYVGATDAFIRMPFLVEGMLIGILSAVFAFFLLGFGYTYLLEWVKTNYTEQLPIIYNNAISFWDIAPKVFAGFSGLGVFIGVAGSGVFVRKYLKV